jgi:hypothetical protein
MLPRCNHFAQSVRPKASLKAASAQAVGEQSGSARGDEDGKKPRRIRTREETSREKVGGENDREERNARKGVN